MERLANNPLIWAGLLGIFWVSLLFLPTCSLESSYTDIDTDTGEVQIIISLLEEIEGITILWFDPAGNCYDIRMTYDQPADHNNPKSAAFPQLLKLRHCSQALPMVIITSGYALSSDYFPSELSFLFDTNQLIVEHRFFRSSIPDPVDWRLLDIRQAASDHHRVIEALKPIYKGPWVSTGASKGGRTAIFHRRFYPDDVRATVAYVAPHIEMEADPRYAEFLEYVGTPECRQNLKDFQITALERRRTMVDMATGSASYDLIGIEQVFERRVIRIPFLFWQYQPYTLCKHIPNASSTDEEVFDFLSMVAPLTKDSDSNIEYYRPARYQAATQTGDAAMDYIYLSKLLLFTHDSMHPALLPEGVDIVFDPAPMADISDWIETQGDALMFIYGEYDPWTKGAYELGESTDSYVFTAPNTNHGAQIADLNEEDQELAISIISRWVGKNAKTLFIEKEADRTIPTFRDGL